MESLKGNSFVKPTGDNLYEQLTVQRIMVPDPEYISEVPERMKGKNFPGFPSTTVFLGMPGSGKTNCFMWMLHSPHVWNKFFDRIYAFGPTVKADKLYKTIKLEDDNVVEKPKEMLKKLESLINDQTESVKKDPSAADKILIIFEDITSFYRKIQSSEDFQRCYTQIRHIKGCSVAMVHKYKAFDRTCRMASQNLLIWKCNKTEVDQLYEDFGPKRLTKDEFHQMVEYAHEATEDNKHPFFYINMTQPEETRFRKNFNEILRLRPSYIPRELSRQSLKRRGGGNTKHKRERSLSPTQQRERSLSPIRGKEERKQKRSRSRDRSYFR